MDARKFGAGEDAVLNLTESEQCFFNGVAPKDIAAARKVLGSIPAPVKSDTVGNGSLPLRCFCVVQALCHTDEPRHSLREIRIFFKKGTF